MERGAPPVRLSSCKECKGMNSPSRDRGSFPGTTRARALALERESELTPTLCTCTQDTYLHKKRTFFTLQAPPPDESARAALAAALAVTGEFALAAASDAAEQQSRLAVFLGETRLNVFLPLCERISSKEKRGRVVLKRARARARARERIDRARSIDFGFFDRETGAYSSPRGCLSLSRQSVLSRLSGCRLCERGREDQIPTCVENRCPPPSPDTLVCVFHRQALRRVSGVLALTDAPCASAARGSVQRVQKPLFAFQSRLLGVSRGHVSSLLTWTIDRVLETATDRTTKCESSRDRPKPETSLL